MTQGKQPGSAPLDAGPPADKTGQPFPPGSGGSPWPAPPPDAAGAPRTEGLAVVALVLAVVSLLVPVLPGIVALVLAAVAARRIRQAPAGAMGGRGLVVVAGVLSTIGVLAGVGLGALVITQRQEPAGWHAAPAAAAARADQFSQVTAPPATEPQPTEPPPPEPATTEPATTEPPTTEPPTATPKIATGKIGDKLTVYDQSGNAQLELTITRVKFTRGDVIDRPQHGLYMGAFAKAYAHADDQELNFYARVGGRLYKQTFSDFFDPWLGYEYLLTGERASGWLVFDVPARHGQLVLRDPTDKHQLAVWKY
jgi:hypothetical protein